MNVLNSIRPNKKSLEYIISIWAK